MTSTPLLCMVTGGRPLSFGGATTLQSNQHHIEQPINRTRLGGGADLNQKHAAAVWRTGQKKTSIHVLRAMSVPDVEKVQEKQEQHQIEQIHQPQQEELQRPQQQQHDEADETGELHLTVKRRFETGSSPRILRISQDDWPRYPNFSFTVEATCKKAVRARTGTLRTPHGTVQTPAFIFCGTKAAIKGLTAETMKQCGSQMILSNTYHLLVHPGGEAIEKMGGLQKATRWDGPMLTDSGGYQIFSMGHGSVSDEIKGRRRAKDKSDFVPSLVSIGEDGARFKSYHDRSTKLLTPERSIEIQKQLGADLVVVLDECTPFHVDKAYTEASMHRTHRWAVRSLRKFIEGDDGSQALYGIIQGGVYPDLREQAVNFVNRQPFFGIAVGGSLGATKAGMHEVVSQTMATVRRDRPVHLLGIGSIADIFHGVRQGIDTFDCVQPTRLGRHGTALVKASFWEKERQRDDDIELAQLLEEWTTGGEVEEAHDRESRKKQRATKRRKPQRCTPREHASLLKGRYSDDHRPIDESCGCPTCRAGYTRAYINHLGRAGELLGGILVSQHNVFFMNELMAAIRRAIRDDDLDEEEEKWLAPGLRSWDIHAQAAMDKDEATIV